jgi:2-keto-4-pentenoate hydratase
MNAQAAADWLYNSIQAQDVLADPPNGLGANLKDAYAIQEALVARMEENDGPAVGWKVALTSPVMQQMCGVDHPCEGAVLQARVQQSPAVCDTSKLGRLGVEAEIALVIDRDMPVSSGPYTQENAAPFIAAKLIANNSLNAGIVMGPALENWSGHDLSALKGAMLIDGEVIAEGTGADILGHPLKAR